MRDREIGQSRAAAKLSLRCPFLPSKVFAPALQGAGMISLKSPSTVDRHGPRSVCAGTGRLLDRRTSLEQPAAPSMGPALPPAFPPQDIVGRWGLAAYHKEEDRARTEAAATRLQTTLRHYARPDGRRHDAPRRPGDTDRTAPEGRVQGARPTSDLPKIRRRRAGSRSRSCSTAAY